MDRAKARIVPALLLAILWLAPDPAWSQSWAQFLVHPALRALGLSEGQATLESINTERIILRDVQLSPAVRAARVIVTFDGLEVFRGNVDAVIVEDATLQASIDAAGKLSIEGLPIGTEQTDKPASPMAFPLRHLTVRDATITLQSPGGMLTAKASAKAEFSGSVEVSGELSVQQDANTLKLTMDNLEATPLPANSWRITLAGALGLNSPTVRTTGPIQIAAEVGADTAGEVQWHSPRIRMSDGVALDAVQLQAYVTVPASREPSIAANFQADTASGAGWSVGQPKASIRGTVSDLVATLATAEQPKPLNLRLARGRMDKLSVQGVLQIGWLTAMARAFGHPVHGEGKATIALSVETPANTLVASAANLLTTAKTKGYATLALSGVRWGDDVAMAQIAGRIVAKAGENVANIRMPNGVRITDLALSDAIRSRLPPALAPLLKDPVFVAYGGPTLGSPEITLLPNPDGSLRIESQLAMRLGNPAFALVAEGPIALDRPAGTAPHLTSKAMTLRLVDTEVGAMRASGEVVLENLSARPGSAQADVTLSARTGGSPAPTISFAQADLDTKIALDWDQDQLNIDLKPGGRARLLGLTGQTIRMTRPTTLQLADGRQHRLRMDLATGDISGALAFARFGGSFNARKAGTVKHPAKFVFGGLQADIAPDAVRLRITNGTITAPQVPLSADKITVDVKIDLAKNQQAGRLNIGRIRHAVRKPFMVPLQLQLDITGKGQRLNLKGRLSDLRRRIAFTVKGQHNLTNGIGSAEFRAPMLFLPNVLQPADLFPSARGLILDANAQITLDANARWSPRGLTQNGKLAMSFERLTTAELSLRNASAVVHLASVVPPVTDGPQKITIGRLDVGVPLTLGEVSLDLRSLDDIRLHLQQFDLFGGRVSAAPLRLDPKTLGFSTVLKVSGIDLAQILAFADFGELTAEGELAGRIPIVAKGGEMLVQGARLETAKPGRIRYSAAGVGGALEKANQATDLLVQALKDFRYDKVSIDLDERDSEELQILLHIAGESARPLTHGGVTLDRFPIEININVEGPMRQIMSDAVDDAANISSFTWSEDGS